MTKLFEKTEDGLLVEVDPTNADRIREGRTVSAIFLQIEVLLTAEEEADRAAEQAAAQVTQEKEAAEQAARAERRAAAEAKLGALGLTPEDMEVLRS